MNITINEPTVQVCVTSTRVKVIIPMGGSLPVANPPKWYTELPYYASDEAAIAGGLTVGMIYRCAAVNNFSYKKGTIVEVEAV
jgi:hypothetical protein